MKPIGEIAQKRYNVNVNEFSERKQRYNVINVNVSEPKTKQERIAWKVVEKLDDPKSYQFFLKCAWHLSEDEIWSTVEVATRKTGVKNPARYATAILKRKLLAK